MSLAYSRVEAYADLWMLSSSQRERYCLVAIEVIRPYNVFIDESVQNRYGREIIGVTAYAATFKRWVEMENTWNEVLERYEVPILPKTSAPFFHMTDFIARKKQFKNDWNDERRNEFIGELANLAAQHTIMGVGSALATEDYEAALPEDIKGKWKDPWYFLVFNCLAILIGVPKFFPVKLESPIYCLFDRKKKFVEMASQLFYATKDDAEIDSLHLLGDMGFGSKEECAPLQAADLLVYSAVRDHVESQQNPKQALFKTLDVLNQDQRLYVPFLNKEHIETYVRFAREQEQRKEQNEDSN
jgi:hypothetical protein